MIKDSTSISTHELINENNKKPHPSSVMFIRQFARVCINCGGVSLKSYIAN